MLRCFRVGFYPLEWKERDGFLQFWKNKEQYECQPGYMSRTGMAQRWKCLVLECYKIYWDSFLHLLVFLSFVLWSNICCYCKNLHSTNVTVKWICCILSLILSVRPFSSIIERTVYTEEKYLKIRTAWKKWTQAVTYNVFSKIYHSY